MFSIDPLDTSMKHIEKSGEPIINSVKLGMPPGEKHIYTIDELAGMNVQREQFAEAWRRVWVDKTLDIILAPGAQNTAVPHDKYSMPPYTLVWNYLDVSDLNASGQHRSDGIPQYPACIIPYGKASKELDAEPMVLDPRQGPSCKLSTNERHWNPY
ncbi:hypothetical protein MPH_01922 [Macrophomina phaseolina MS6]|uniref:Amidase n=1 Tax=Macrophomina phaseolina (strain MS6) TaxID=1126212 RepID=K2SVX9_MACPH|nr:hypothetical protein MPH_01922 [Macrophomina phaseolina MS6]